MRTSTQEIPQKAQQGIDRFGELLAEYARMTGVAGDVLKLGARDLLVGVLTDAIHWGSMSGVDHMLAYCEAYRTALEERVQE